jgi:FMN phosphatase YigB (HAD superfamily)
MTGTKAYFIGKPNPMIMSHALKALQTSIEDTVIIGDRMDTDIQAGKYQLYLSFRFRSWNRYGIGAVWCHTERGPKKLGF